MNSKKNHRSSFGPVENAEMKEETLQNTALNEKKQGDRKRVLVAFLSDSVTFVTVKHFLSLLQTFPNLEVVTLADIYNHQKGILESSLDAGSSDDLIQQEQGNLRSPPVEAVILILTETMIDIWTSGADYHCQTKYIEDKRLKTLVKLCHDLRRNDQVMTMAVNYDFSNEDSLKLKTFRSLNKGIKVFKIISYSAQLGFQLNIDAIHQMLQYLCDSNYRSLQIWKESMDAKLLLESIKKEGMVGCTLNSARKRQCPIHGLLSEIDTCHINKFDLQCCERNEDYTIPPGGGQVTQHVQKKDIRVNGGTRVCHDVITEAVHQAELDDESVGSSNGRTAFAKVHFDAKASSFYGQFCPSVYYQSNIANVNFEPKEDDVVIYKHNHNKFHNDEKMVIPNHSGNSLTILNDISLKDKGLFMQDLNGGDSCLQGIVEETRRKSIHSKDDQRADSGVYTSYIEPDEAALYPDIFIPPAELDEVYVETTVNALMDEIVLINKIYG
ncbi:hypothetical protein CHS0354_037772 [Potamilus streckersoni]|uniref:Uncharacterized protein n=1 Tax=Potamilus streckersoni TaxID=2493646 RepID=A0AAE0T499_9BIVA|nr:hypothetical protein CHS0354_037772 [Potamilus streckersoni]